MTMVSFAVHTCTSYFSGILVQSCTCSENILQCILGYKKKLQLFKAWLVVVIFTSRPGTMLIRNTKTGIRWALTFQVKFKEIEIVIFFFFPSNIMWFFYGYLKQDSTLMIVNSVGSFLQSSYMIVFIFYTKSKVCFSQAQIPGWWAQGGRGQDPSLLLILPSFWLDE